MYQDYKRLEQPGFNSEKRPNVLKAVGGEIKLCYDFETETQSQPRFRLPNLQQASQIRDSLSVSPATHEQSAAFTSTKKSWLRTKCLQTWLTRVPQLWRGNDENSLQTEMQ